MTQSAPPKSARHIDVPLDRDRFMRKLIRELSGTLEENVGIEEAAGFISLVGLRLGNQLNGHYRTALGADGALSGDQVDEVLVDLKRRIGGDFYICERDDEKIVLANGACPFGDQAIGRRSLCMMTSNVFGVLAAENLGYAKVCLEETIAQGHAGCRVVILLRPDEAGLASDGREYFQSAAQDDDRT